MGAWTHQIGNSSGFHCHLKTLKQTNLLSLLVNAGHSTSCYIYLYPPFQQYFLCKVCFAESNQLPKIYSLAAWSENRTG